MDKYLTVEEVAKRYSVTPYTVRKWVSIGKLRATRFLRQKRIYITESALAEMEGQR